MNAFDVININGSNYNYAQGFDHFTETITSYFPEEKEGINKYVEKLKRIGMSLTDILEGRAKPNNGVMASFEHFYENTQQYLSSLTSNYRLQNVLAGLNSLYAGHPDTTPLYLHGIINHSLIESSWRMVDGGSQIADILSKGILEKEGKL